MFEEGKGGRKAMVEEAKKELIFWKERGEKKKYIYIYIYIYKRGKGGKERTKRRKRKICLRKEKE